MTILHERHAKGPTKAATPLDDSPQDLQHRLAEVRQVLRHP
jgi:hypothetical protein